MRRTIVAMLVSTVALTAHAQTVSVTGRVVADATGDPIPNVRVALTVAAPGSPVLTDGDGRFALPTAAGRQSVIASKSGYARSEPTPVSAGQPIEIRLRRGATISGRVVDRFGEAVAAIRVAAQIPAAGSANPATVATAETDDRGEYRISSLSAGRFLVVVNTMRPVTTTRVVNNTPVLETRPTLERTYYPGVATPEEAEPLQVQFGEERSDIDFVVADDHAIGNPYSTARIASPLQPPPLPPGSIATAIVRGHVASTDGRSLPRADVSLISSGFRFARRALADNDGAFEFADLSAGKYLVVASKAGFAPTESPEPGTGFAAILNSGREIEVAAGETREKVDVTLRRIDATDRPLAFGRREQSVTGVEVVLTDRVSELIGTIMDDNARPVPGAHVVVFPTNRDRWYPGSRYLRTVTADADGVFAVTGLPFGIYYAAALAQLPAEGADAWQDPVYLESLVTRGRTFTISGDGDTVTLNLRISAR